jgi:cytochrome P450
MEARKKGEAKSSIETGEDLLSIILSDPLYSEDFEKTLDDLLILFLAGNETIKISSTNTTCYLTLVPDAKAKFLAEVSPVIEKAGSNLVDDLTTDEVEHFDFARYCWYEAMRLEPPAPGSISNSFCKPVTLGGITFDTDIGFSVNF